MTKFCAFLPVRAYNYKELHFNFLLAFVSKSMVLASALLLQHYHFLKRF
jgi:hypothetical protein